MFDKIERRPIQLNNSNTNLNVIIDQYGISKRELEILKLILEGKNNKEIKDSLFISYHTVKNHVYNLYQKVGVKNRFQLIAIIRDNIQ
jgi:DNA-binding CsgD family transcriptional regulator